jgi:hypothetical protein
MTFHFLGNWWWVLVAIAASHEAPTRPVHRVPHALIRKDGWAPKRPMEEAVSTASSRKAWRSDAID